MTFRGLFQVIKSNKLSKIYILTLKKLKTNKICIYIFFENSFSVSTFKRFLLPKKVCKSANWTIDGALHQFNKNWWSRHKSVGSKISAQIYILSRAKLLCPLYECKCADIVIQGKLQKYFAQLLACIKVMKQN